MAYPETRGLPGKVDNLGKIIYFGDGTTFYPSLADTAGIGHSGRQVVAQREPFIFRPGATALASGMVPSGTRSGGGTMTSGTVASSVYWASWVTYQPLRTGKIDGLSSGGIIEGQLSIGVKLSAGTGVAQLTARIANTANTGSPTTILGLTSTITCTTAEIFQTYDIPYLACDTVLNAIPFSVAIGAQHSQGGSSVVIRIMESSFIQGEFEPKT